MQITKLRNMITILEVEQVENYAKYIDQKMQKKVDTVSKI